MRNYIDKSGLRTIGEYINEQDNLLSQQVATKQDQLVSGTNIKTINSESLLGAGNIDLISSLMVEITWAELKALRDAGELVPGMQYRITDYQCTTVTSNTSSAGHAFDIIVVADDESHLNESARAILHEGDTYFANSELSKWQLSYCLDNDTTRFAWADTTNGKGVIFRMVDEFGNDVPYDFKNIQFIGKASVKMLRYGSYYSASMSRLESSDTTIDNINYYAFSFSIVSGPGGPVETYYTPSLSDMSTWFAISGGVATVTTNVIVKVPSGITVGSFYYTFSVNTVDASINGISNKVYSNIIVEYNDPISVVQQLNTSIFIVASGSLTCYGNRIGVRFYDNIIGAGFDTNTIDSNFYGNIIGSNFCNNAIGSSFYNNSIGDNFYYNTISVSFNNNIIGYGFYANIVGSNFYNNSIGNSFQYNSIGGFFSSNTIGNQFTYNSISAYFRNNTIGANFSYNDVDTYFMSNVIGSYFYYNIIGTYFSNNAIGNYFQSSSVGSDFQHNTIYSSESGGYTYAHYCKFDEGIQYIFLTSIDASPTQFNWLQNVNIHSGVKGTSSNMLTVFIPDRNLPYSTDVFLDEQSNLVIQPLANTSNVAPLYDASSTYAVNDLCIYAGQLYKCTTAISTAEAWTAAHWAATSLSAELASQVTAAINGSY